MWIGHTVEGSVFKVEISFHWCCNSCSFISFGILLGNLGSHALLSPRWLYSSSPTSTNGQTKLQRLSRNDFRNMLWVLSRPLNSIPVPQSICRMCQTIHGILQMPSWFSFFFLWKFRRSSVCSFLMRMAGEAGWSSAPSVLECADVCQSGRYQSSWIVYHPNLQSRLRIRCFHWPQRKNVKPNAPLIPPFQAQRQLYLKLTQLPVQIDKRAD